MCQYFRTRNVLVAWGDHQQEQRVNMRKASSMLACRQGRCRSHLRLGRAVISRGRAIGTCCFHTAPTNPFLRCQHQQASLLRRAFAAFDPGHGSRGSATLALIIPQAMNRSRPIQSSRSWPRWTTMLQHQVMARLLSLRGGPDAAVQRAAAHE